MKACGRKRGEEKEEEREGGMGRGKKQEWMHKSTEREVQETSNA